MQLINFDNAGVSRPRALQALSRSRHICFLFQSQPYLTSYNKLIFLGQLALYFSRM